MKITGLLRSLGMQLLPTVPWVEFGFNFGVLIGQMAYEIPSVFSFFLPEYQPAGTVTRSSLVAPEAQVLTGPRIIDSFNGIFSLI